MKKSRWYGIASFALATLGLFAVAIPAVFYWYKFGSFNLAGAQEPWAHLGEYFGGVTAPLLALFTLIALAVTFRLQAIELEETRAESNRQRAALDRQTFEGTLFQLLHQFREVASAVHVPSGKPPGYLGREAFSRIYRSMSTMYLPEKMYPSPPQQNMAKVAEIYGEIYRNNEPELGPYFRILYHIFKHIDQSPGSAEEKARYASIARAQLSSKETLVLFYNCTWGEGRNFRALIERYGILKHVPQQQLLSPVHMEYREWYGVAAFQSLQDRRLKSPTPTMVNARHGSISEPTPPDSQS